MMPFQPVADSTVTLNATTSSQAVALGATPRTGPFQVRVKNASGGADASVRFGDPSVTATTAGLSIPAGGVEVFTLGNLDRQPVTHVAAITASGTAALSFTTGYGV